MAVPLVLEVEWQRVVCAGGQGGHLLAASTTPGGVAVGHRAGASHRTHFVSSVVA